MRILAALITVILLVGMASAGFYPMNPDITSYVQTDAPGVTNVEAIPVIQLIGSSTAGPEANDDDQLATGLPANNTTGINRSTFTAQPDYPRGILVTPSGAITGIIKITGTNIAGATLYENLTFSNSATAQTTLSAFKTVTRAQGYLTQETARTLEIGTGSNLGLNNKLASNTTMFALLNGTRTSISAVTVSSSVLSRNTISMGGSMANTSPVKVYYYV